VLSLHRFGRVGRNQRNVHLSGRFTSSPNGDGYRCQSSSSEGPSGPAGSPSPWSCSACGVVSPRSRHGRFPAATQLGWIRAIRSPLGPHHLRSSGKHRRGKHHGCGLRPGRRVRRMTIRRSVSARMWTLLAVSQTRWPLDEAQITDARGAVPGGPPRLLGEIVVDLAVHPTDAAAASSSRAPQARTTRGRPNCTARSWWRQRTMAVVAPRRSASADDLFADTVDFAPSRPGRIYVSATRVQLKRGRRANGRRRATWMLPIFSSTSRTHPGSDFGYSSRCRQESTCG